VIPGVYDAVREHDRGMLTFCLALIAILWVPFMFFSTVRNYRANRKTRQRIAALDLLLATEQGGNG
jgi:heme/copper-type cytochrome/quinol oxidase subunit 2